MTREEALAKLDEVRRAMHDQFPGNPGRLEQLDSALSTAGMAVEHLHDEEAREADLRKRLVEGDTHGPGGSRRSALEVMQAHGHQVRAEVG